MIDEQRRLLKHYEDLANNVTKDRGGRDFKPLIRENARKHADQILKGYPALQEKVEVKKAEKKGA